MGKWTARLAEGFSNAPNGGTDKTNRSPLLQVLSVPSPVASDKCEVWPGPFALTADQADRAHAEPWSDGDGHRYLARTVLFMRQGINAIDANDLAELLHLRDVDRDAGRDDRVVCIECRHYRPRPSDDCANAQAAGERLRAPHMATMLQRCPGFAPARLDRLDSPKAAP